MKKNTRSNGQSLAEFALTLPLLLLVIMGIFDLGRGIFYYSVINNAAREGARFGAVYCDSPGIKNAVRTRALGLVEDSDIDDEIFSNDGIPERVVVTVTYEFNTVTPLIGKFFDDGSITLTGKARQLIESPSTCN